MKSGFHAPILMALPVMTRPPPNPHEPAPKARAKLHPQIQNRWDDEKKNQQHTPAIKQKIKQAARYITRHDTPQTRKARALTVRSHLKALLHFL